MKPDECTTNILAYVNSHVLGANLRTAGSLALGLVEIRTRLRELDAALPDAKGLAGGAISEIMSALEQCERTLADERGAFDYYSSQVRYTVTNNINALASANTQEQHALTNQNVRRQVLAMTDGKCTYCDTPLSDDDNAQGKAKLCIEHVIPVSKGGPNHIVNYVPSCGSCNSAKGDRHVLHFVRIVQPAREARNNVMQLVEAAE